MWGDDAIPARVALKKTVIKAFYAGLPGLAFSKPPQKFGLILNWLASKFLRVY